MISGIEFESPWVLGWLALLPLYALLRGRAGRRASVLFSSTGLARGIGQPARAAVGQWLVGLRLLAVALGLVALAGPRFSRQRDETLASGVDIMLVLDLSWSMMAQDMGQEGRAVSRLDAARSVLRDFIRRRPGDRLGLVVFSGVPYLASPLTLNHEWLLRNLDRLHVGLMHELGTAIGDASAAALRRLSSLRQSRSRVIILLTDGDNNRGGVEPVAAAELAAALGARMHTIGIGREDPCPLPAFDPDTGQLRRDGDGKIIPVMTLQPANYRVLARMSEKTRGQFYRAGSESELERIYDEIDRLEKTEVRVRRHTMHTPLFRWPLLAALAVFGGELALIHTWFRGAP